MLTLSQIGKQLKEIRKELGLSQEFVSKELDVNRQAIIAIESGKRKIDSFELFKLARLYNINIEDLMAEKKQAVSNFQEAVMHLRKKNLLTDKEKSSLLEFQKISDDYEFLKQL